MDDIYPRHCGICKKKWHFIATSLIYDYVRQNDYTNLQSFFSHKQQFPCFVQDYAQNYEMIEYLKSKKSYCNSRSKLTNILLGFESEVKIDNQIQNIEDAIEYGSLEMVRYFLKSSLRSSKTSRHWNDFVVQDCIVLEFKLYCKNLLVEFPQTLVDIILGYGIIWDLTLVT